MGCLLELLFLPLELIIELIADSWFSAMQWIVPEKYLGKAARVILFIIVAILSAILLVIFLVGIFAVLFTEDTLADFWAFIFIPLGISIIQILCGIIVRKTAKRKKDNDNKQ